MQTSHELQSAVPWVCTTSGAHAASFESVACQAGQGRLAQELQEGEDLGTQEDEDPEERAAMDALLADAGVGSQPKAGACW